MFFKITIALFSIVATIQHCQLYAQSTDNNLGVEDNVSYQLFRSINEWSAKEEMKIHDRTAKAISKLEKLERKIYKSLQKRDSISGNKFLSESKEKYARFKDVINSKSTGKISPYFSKLDSIKTTLSFLDSYGNSKFSQEIKASITSIENLENTLSVAEEANRFLKNRQSTISQMLSSSENIKLLKRVKEEVFYYSSHLKGLKSTLSNPKKLQKSGLELVMNLPAVKTFFKENSTFASIFRLPGNGVNSTAAALVQNTNLQTQGALQAILHSKELSQGFNVSDLAIQASNNFKSKSLPDERNSLKMDSTKEKKADVEVNPNKLKGKSVRDRMEVGFNHQNIRSTDYFPNISEFRSLAGYKINTLFSLGIGLSYKMGWGQSIRNIKLTHEGVGLNAFVEYKISKAIFFYGGYEQHYLERIKVMDELRNFSAWSPSGMVGVVLKKKMKGLFSSNVQILYDVIQSRSSVNSNKIILRIGYTLN